MGKKTEKMIREKAKKGFDLGFELENKYGECPQVTTRALQIIYDELNDEIFRYVGFLAGGGGCQSDGSCGAYCAGLMFLSSKYGRTIKDIETLDEKGLLKIREKNIPIQQKLHEKFIQEYGTIICQGIHRKLMGRPFWAIDPHDLQLFLDMGGHEKVCPYVVGNAVKWTIEIYEEVCAENLKQ
jgi:hypothetical protein